MIISVYHLEQSILAYTKSAFGKRSLLARLLYLIFILSAVISFRRMCYHDVQFLTAEGTGRKLLAMLNIWLKIRHVKALKCLGVASNFFPHIFVASHSICIKYLLDLVMGFWWFRILICSLVIGHFTVLIIQWYLVKSVEALFLTRGTELWAKPASRALPNPAIWSLVGWCWSVIALGWGHFSLA